MGQGVDKTCILHYTCKRILETDGHLLRLWRNLMRSATNRTSPSFRSVVARRASSIVNSSRLAASTGGTPISKSVTEISKARAIPSSRQAATFFDSPLSTRPRADRVIPGGDSCCVRVAKSLTDQPRASLKRRIFAPSTLNLPIFGCTILYCITTVSHFASFVKLVGHVEGQL